MVCDFNINFSPHAFMYQQNSAFSFSVAPHRRSKTSMAKDKYRDAPTEVLDVICCVLRDYDSTKKRTIDVLTIAGAGIGWRPSR